MVDIKRQITEAEYNKAKKETPYSLISDNIKMGYGVYGASVYEEDGKYYLEYSRGDSCD